MRKAIILAALTLAAPAFAYTDANGYHEPGECNIMTATCGKYVDELPTQSARAWDYCERVVGQSNVLMEYCLNAENEAGQRIGR